VELTKLGWLKPIIIRSISWWGEWRTWSLGRSLKPWPSKMTFSELIGPFSHARGYLIDVIFTILTGMLFLLLLLNIYSIHW
jgi:hypothetical protein